MYEPKLILTEDGSHTLAIEELDETYHSTHGAITEANYVYIDHGLKQSSKKHIRVLEVGFGTGLNTWLTLKRLQEDESIESIHYTSLEKYPLSKEIVESLNYVEQQDVENLNLFQQLHFCPWNEDVNINGNFTLNKIKCDLRTDELKGEYDVIFYDAFAPSKQAEMWEKEVIEKVTNTMADCSVFSTYCAKGDVRRLLNSLGLHAKRTPGPPGKHEILVARKG